MKHTTPQSAYSLVEVLVSVSVLLIAIVGPMTIASQGIKSSRFALEQNTAFFLAQEGIEAMFVLRNNYGLEDINDGLEASDPDTSWNWLGDIFNGTGDPCASNQLNSPGDSCDFGVDFSATDFITNVYDCNTNPDTDCRLYFNENNTRAKFSHNNSDSETPYTRVVTITYGDTYVVEVVSTVTWESSVFGNVPQTVSLRSFIFDPI